MAGFLNIGEMGALALHVLVELTALRESEPDSRRTVQDLADQLLASTHTLHKVARRLIMLGMVEGARGVNGGLRLALDPDKLNLLSVIQGIEGKVSSNGCMFAKRVCPADGVCVFEGLTGKLENMLNNYFYSTTLSDLWHMSGTLEQDKK